MELELLRGGADCSSTKDQPWFRVHFKVVHIAAFCNCFFDCRWSWQIRMQSTLIMASHQVCAYSFLEVHTFFLKATHAQWCTCLLLLSLSKWRPSPWCNRGKHGYGGSANRCSREVRGAVPYWAYPEVRTSTLIPSHGRMLHAKNFTKCIGLWEVWCEELLKFWPSCNLSTT